MCVFPKTGLLYFKLLTVALVIVLYQNLWNRFMILWNPCGLTLYFGWEAEEIKTKAMTFLLSAFQYDGYFEACVMEQMQKSSLNKLCWHRCSIIIWNCHVNGSSLSCKAKCDKNNQNKQILTGTVIQCVDTIAWILHLHSISFNIGTKKDSKTLKLD